MRPPEMLSGPTAARWDQVGKGFLLSAFVLVIVYAIVKTVVELPTRLDLIMIGSFGALLVIGFAIRFGGLLKFRAEAHAGYSTLQDITGIDLRNAVTGEIIRSKDQPKAEWSRVSWIRSVNRFDRYKYEPGAPAER
jgi:hypothetical protein